MQNILLITLIILIVIVVFVFSRKFKQMQQQIAELKKNPEQNVPITEPYSPRKKIMNDEYNVYLLTGGAGTGKTYLIQNLVKNEIVDNVVAFTAMAALNAKGDTIHKLFQLKPTIILPELYDKQGPLGQDNQASLANTEILAIDEISMVRADLLDAIDWRFRSIKGINKPFGGVKIIMVGDPYQLPPIVEKRDEKYFGKNKIWESGWFFDAKSFRESKVYSYELKHVYRQSDPEYIAALNSIRKFSDISNSINFFNTHCKKTTNENSLFIVSQNTQAADRNNAEMKKLNGKTYNSIADLSGSYEQRICEKEEKAKLPAPYKLRLKINSRVMLLINDPDKRYVNGSLATVVQIQKDLVSVKLDESEQIVTITKNVWKDERPVWNRKSHKFEYQIMGVYIQYPMIPAWAITVHKLQGKTLSNAHIAFDRSFEAGQGYVALSRTKNIKDLSIEFPITYSFFQPINQRLIQWTASFPMQKTPPAPLSYLLSHT